MDKIASSLLDIKCLKLSPSNPFTYASGLKGPMYCDNRLLLSHVEKRTFVINAFASILKDKVLEFDQLAGLATAGIPHAAFLGQSLELPMVYIRSKAKSHGRSRCIEGDFQKGQKLLLVEDLVNQGSSLNESVLTARAEGAIITDCLCIVDYEMQKSRDVLAQLGIKLHSLTSFTSIIQTALSLEIIDEKEYQLLIKWQKDPINWGP